MSTIRVRMLVMSMAIVVGMDAAACICVESDPKTAFKQSHEVFLGEVIEESGIARMRVIEAFKGDAGEEVDVDPMSMSSCSYAGAITPGSRHLIYGWRDGNGQLSASMCSRSAPEARAACDLRFLRARAWWWRSPLSSLRVLRALGIRGDPCPRAQ